MAQIKHIGISDYFVSDASRYLRTSGLGSCVGVILFDKNHLIGGLSHIMLPERPANKKVHDFKKYCNTNIPLFIQSMVDIGACRKDLQGAIFGGAEMFRYQKNPLMNIGKRNIAATLRILNEQDIPVLFKNVGGRKGRTIQLNILEGKILLRTAFEEDIIYPF
ncbi:chemotaxis protein CheD [Priestia megaterium]|nr:chemotaxis protein CheD [Priestia megaterium]